MPFPRSLLIAGLTLWVTACASSAQSQSDQRYIYAPERSIDGGTGMFNMNLRPTDVVADIGAGSGYFTFRIAAMVPQGKVLAVDIQPEMLAMVEARKLSENVSNVEGVLGDLQSTNLPPDSVDVAFLVDAYHEFSHPYEMMASIFTALKPGGRLILVEYRGEDRNVPIRPLHKMTQAQVKREMDVFDLEFEETLDFLPWQHMMIFSKR